MGFYCIIIIVMQRVAEKENMFFSWIKWHYTVQMREVYLKWKNVLLFTVNYFSVDLLLRTYFSPWRKYKWSYGKGFSFQRYFEVAISNLFSRVVGAIVRTFVIVVGMFSVLFVLLLGIPVILFWVLVPLLIFIFLLLCLTLI